MVWLLRVLRIWEALLWFSTLENGAIGRISTTCESTFFSLWARVAFNGGIWRYSILLTYDPRCILFAFLSPHKL